MKKIFLLSLALLAGCAGLGGHIEPPTVHVASLSLSSVTLFEQQYKLGLRLQNPNDVDLPIEGLSYELEVNDQPFAKGVSSHPVTVPRYGSAVLDVEGFSTLGDLLRQYKQWAKGEFKGLRYHMKGKLTLQGGLSVPFDRKGEIGLPEVSPVTPKPAAEAI
jgi:LEA14-like dessication related protein